MRRHYIRGMSNDLSNNLFELFLINILLFSLRFISIEGECFENHHKIQCSVFAVPQYCCASYSMSLQRFSNVKW